MIWVPTFKVRRWGTAEAGGGRKPKADPSPDPNAQANVRGAWLRMTRSGYNFGNLDRGVWRGCSMMRRNVMTLAALTFVAWTVLAQQEGAPGLAGFSGE